MAVEYAYFNNIFMKIPLFPVYYTCKKREVREEKTSKQGYGGGVYNDNRYITTSLDPFQGNGLPFPLNTGLPFSYGLKM